MDKAQLRYWVGFNRAKGIGPYWLRVLLDKFGDIARAWHASSAELHNAGLNQRALASLLAVRTQCDLDAELRAIERTGAWVLTLHDPEYPSLLKTIEDAPPVLYIKGTLTEADQYALSVVGTRRATPYGKTMTAELVEPLAERGITIVSGLAYGIDIASHEAALRVGGRTIAVLPSGIDRIYPPEHIHMAEKIAANGALISELPLGEPAERIHFAPRNRIISGLSLGTLVVEAGEKSGVFMTVNYALAQGREVLAVPGNALSPTSKGPNLLIRQGARVATSADDILNVLNDVLSVEYRQPALRLGISSATNFEAKEKERSAEPEYDPENSSEARLSEKDVKNDGVTTKAGTTKPGAVKLENVAKFTNTNPIPAKSTRIGYKSESEVEANLLRMLSEVPQHIDTLAVQLELPVNKVSSMLTILELKGLVKQAGIMQYELVHPLDIT